MKRETRIYLEKKWWGRNNSWIYNTLHFIFLFIGVYTVITTLQVVPSLIILTIAVGFGLLGTFKRI